jgi:hypothetical protein
MRLDSVLANLLTCHELRAGPEIMRTKMAQLWNAIRAPFERHCAIQYYRERIIRDWEENQV